jgi:membrane associated rhomboid family serine protease
MTWDFPPGPHSDPSLARPTVATIPLHPFRRPPRLLILVLVAATTAFTLVVAETRISLTAIGVVYAVLGFLAVVAFRTRRLTERAPIVVTGDSVVLPAGTLTAATRSVPLEEVTSIERRGSGKRRLLIVGTRERPLVLPVAALVEVDGVDRLRRAVRDAMRAKPEGLALVAAMAEREAAGRSAGRRPPRATMTLVAVVGVVFVLELATGALDDKSMLLRLGANAPILVRLGEWWRPITANLLHISFMHVYFNAAALLSLGTMLERSLGTSRFVVAALTAGVAGHLTSVIAGRLQVVSAGASAIAFGLMGALLLINVRHRRRLPTGFVLGRRQWILLLGINGAISLLPMVDGLAHLGGLLGGAFPMLLFAHRLEMGPRMRAACSGVATALVLLYVAAVGATTFHFVTDDADPARELAAALLAPGTMKPEQLNDIAWSIALDRTSTPELLARAEDAARRAGTMTPGNGIALDTRAYLLHRLGRADEACTLERRAAWLTTTPETFTMLHRFLTERNRESPTPPVRIERSGGQLVARATGHDGAVVYASVVGERRIGGLLRVVLPAGADEGHAPAPRDLPDVARFDVLLVDTEPIRPEQPGATMQVAYRGLDATTLGLP